MPIPALDPKHIHLLSWNIAKGRHHEWRYDLQRLTDGVDLTLIQEARLEHAMHEVVEDGCWAFAPGYRRANHTTGVMTIARAQTIKHQRHSHREPLTRLPKAALITEYRLHDHPETLLVANIHAINFTAGTRHFEHQLWTMARTVVSHRGPLIVCGDFNTWRGKRMRIVQQMITALELEAAEFEQDHRSQAFGFALDHVFYRGLRHKTCRVSRVASSDHNPLHVVLSV